MGDQVVSAVRQGRGSKSVVVVTLSGGRQVRAGGNRAARAAVAVVEYVPDGLRVFVSLRQDVASGESYGAARRRVWSAPHNVGRGFVVEVVPVVDAEGGDES